MSISALNIELFSLINGLAGKNTVLDGIMLFSAQFIVFFTPIFLLYLWFRQGDRPEDRKMVMLVFVSILLALVVSVSISLFYYHPRPFVLGIGTSLLHPAPDSSFPSDHTTSVFAAAFPLLFSVRYRRYGGAFFGLALLVGFSRIFCGVHYPLDIAGSFTVSLIVSGILFTYRERIYPFFTRLLEIYDKITARITAGMGN